jgi:hypothetical protein
VREQVKKAVDSVKGKLDKKTVSTAIGAGGFLGFLYGSDPKIFEHVTQIAHNGKISFLQLLLIGGTIVIGAIIHSTRVSKAISSNFEKYAEQLTGAIDKVADVLSQELEAQRKSMDNLKGDVQQLSERVTKLESNK